MLFLQGVGCKTYWELFAPGQPLPEIPCPKSDCTGLLHGHGWYRRYLNGELVPIRRGLCDGCEVTHAVLPEDVCAYHDLTLWTLECALETEGGPTAVAQATGQAGEVGVRRARRWQRRQRAPWIAEVLALLPPAAGRWWDRVRAVVGPEPGALIRLRRWLWSTWRCFFSGLTGLYRHGQPRTPFRRNSTDLGIFLQEIEVS